MRFMKRSADIAATVEHITDVRRIAKINLLGCSAGSQRTGVYVMEHPEKVARWVFCSGFWKGTADFREFNRNLVPPDGGHMILLEKGYRHFQHEVLHFFDSQQ